MGDFQSSHQSVGIQAHLSEEAFLVMSLDLLGSLFPLFSGKIVPLLHVTYILFELFSPKGWKYSCRSAPGYSNSPRHRNYWSRSLHLPKSRNVLPVGLVNGPKIWSSLFVAFLKMTKMEIKLLIQINKCFTENHTKLFYFLLKWERKIKLLFLSFSLIITCWIFGSALKLKNQWLTQLWYPAAYVREWLIVTQLNM